MCVGVPVVRSLPVPRQCHGEQATMTGTAAVLRPKGTVSVAIRLRGRSVPADSVLSDPSGWGQYTVRPQVMCRLFADGVPGVKADDDRD